ncbi:carboxypeptidase M32 [Ruegeria marina]|uniref:Metal-dependent carboxypeptidase n=1 Tax=Ruegeria marina TaxID=639004 RepID=A0A1G6IU45_9RHOB|nr:carboxypeptidase M32 [Ruegeria marina]SDC09941.1 carboxypeptidase Taq Metallo peptidase. MEROPS family M32 [Ruegeria marina]
MTAFDELMAFQRETSALGQVAGRLGWDQETVMPKGAAPQRGEEKAAMAAILHERRCDPRVAEWLAAAEAPDLAGAAQLREIRRAYERTTRVPADLARAIARTTTRAHAIWAQARADEDVASFLPVLEEVVALRRQEAQALAGDGDAYDALVEDYERATTGAQIAGIFDAMRPRLVALRAAVLERPAPKVLDGSFDEAAQMKLSRRLARAFGYDMYHGRVDKAVHPFSSGSGLDVRITTRTNPLDPFNCFYSTIHEVGHAAYEQNISRDFLLTPLGRGVSMGVHESQSRIYENQLGRSRAFTGWIYGQMREVFGDFGIDGPEAFYATVNTVHRGYIRTEADEVQYNLHVMLRFELERALVSGDLAVCDLEAAWNDRFEADFGYPVDKPSNGCLQDVHWSEGLFGYFPTYSLGNVYAGCLYRALRQAVPDLDAALAEGDTSGATSWLAENVQQHGGLYEPRDVITRASGMEPGPEPLLDYLEAKFGALYGL